MNVKLIAVLGVMFLLVCGVYNAWADTYHYSDDIKIDGKSVMVSERPWTTSQNASDYNLTDVNYLEVDEINSIVYVLSGDSDDVQDAINLAYEKDYGTVHVSAHNFTSVSTILINCTKPIVFEGEGIETLFYSDVAGMDVIQVGLDDTITIGCTLKDFKIFGREYGGGAGIKSVNNRRSIYSGIQIEDGSIGLHILANGTTQKTSLNQISDFYIHATESEGILINTIAGDNNHYPYNNANQFVNGYIAHCGVGINISRPSSSLSGQVAHHMFSNVYLETSNSTHKLLSLEKSTLNYFTNVYFDGTGSTHVYLDADSTDNSFVSFDVDGVISDLGNDNWYQEVNDGFYAMSGGAKTFFITKDGDADFTGDLDTNNIKDTSSQSDVLKLNFNNQSIMSDGTILDSSGNGLNVIIHGDTYHNSTGGINGGGAYEYDGTGDYLEVTDNNAISFTNETSFSVETWFKTGEDNIVNYNTLFSKRQVASPTPGYIAYISSSTKYVVFRLDGDAVDVQIMSDVAVNDDDWHHVLVYYNADTDMIGIYLDGVLEDSDSVAGIADFSTTNAFHVGASRSGTTTINGTIDETIIHNKVMDSDYVKRRYYGQKESIDSYVFQTDMKVNTTAIYPQKMTNFQAYNYTMISPDGTIGNCGMLNDKTIQCS